MGQALGAVRLPVLVPCVCAYCAYSSWSGAKRLICQALILINFKHVSIAATRTEHE